LSRELFGIRPDKNVRSAGLKEIPMSVQRCPWTSYSDDALLAGAAGVLYETVKFRRFPAEDAHAQSKRCVRLKGAGFDALPSQRFCQNIFVLFRSLSPGMQPTASIHGTTPPRRILTRAFGQPICASKQPPRARFTTRIASRLSSSAIAIPASLTFPNARAEIAVASLGDYITLSLLYNAKL
jgi:hypothetical protein